MSERHADEATLAAFVRGEIGDESFVDHLAACSHCATRLGAAAKLEVAMFEAAELMAEREPVRVASRRPARHSWASELALAASLVLGIGMPPRWVESDSSDGAVADRGGMIAMSIDPSESQCALPDEGGSCDAPESFLESEALAMTIDPRGTLDESEDGQCMPAVDGSDLVCPADI